MGRGRSYPVIGLGEAIARASQLKDQDGTALTTPEAAVMAWGFKTLHGTSLRIVSALRQYGLLSDTGDQTKLSDRALAILLEPEGSEERQDALRAAAAEPAIFREIEEHYDNNLPGDDALQSYIVRKLNLKEGPAEKLIASLRETREVVNGLGRSYSTSVEPTDGAPAKVAPQPSKAMVTTTAIHEDTGSLTIPLPVVGQGEASLNLPRHMSAEAWGLMVESLKSNLRVWRHAVVAQSDADDAAPNGDLDAGWPNEDDE